MMGNQSVKSHKQQLYSYQSFWVMHMYNLNSWMNHSYIFIGQNIILEVKTGIAAHSNLLVKPLVNCYSGSSASEFELYIEQAAAQER